MEINVNNTLFTGKFLVHLPSVDSTNNYAKQHVAKSSPIDGTVILADEQYSGRGQAGNIWVAEANKNLTFSIIYQTQFLRATEQFYLNMAVSLGIWSMVNSQWSTEEHLSTIDHQLSTVKIKWPNDIYVGGKKIAGILIENTISGMYLNYSVIGIGLNVNQDDFPETMNAVSLKNLLNKEPDRIEILSLLLASIEKQYMLLKERKFEVLKTNYIESLYRYNMKASFKKEETIFEGRITDVDESGNLLIETEEGIQKFGFKEISFVV